MLTAIQSANRTVPCLAWCWTNGSSFFTNRRWVRGTPPESAAKSFPIRAAGDAGRALPLQPWSASFLSESTLSYRRNRCQGAGPLASPAAQDIISPGETPMANPRVSASASCFLAPGPVRDRRSRSAAPPLPTAAQRPASASGRSAAHPNRRGYGNSPYISPSSFAGNPALISPEKAGGGGSSPPGRCQRAGVPGRARRVSAGGGWRRRCCATPSRPGEEKKHPTDYDEVHASTTSGLTTRALLAEASPRGTSWNEWPPEYPIAPAAAGRLRPGARAELDSPGCPVLFLRQCARCARHCREAG